MRPISAPVLSFSKTSWFPHSLISTTTRHGASLLEVDRKSKALIFGVGQQLGVSCLLFIRDLAEAAEMGHAVGQSGHDSVVVLASIVDGSDQLGDAGDAEFEILQVLAIEMLEIALHAKCVRSQSQVESLLDVCRHRELRKLIAVGDVLQPLSDRSHSAQLDVGMDELCGSCRRLLLEALAHDRGSDDDHELGDVHGCDDVLADLERNRGRGLEFLAR